MLLLSIFIFYIDISIFCLPLITFVLSFISPPLIPLHCMSQCSKLISSKHFLCFPTNTSAEILQLRTDLPLLVSQALLISPVQISSLKSYTVHGTHGIEPYYSCYLDTQVPIQAQDGRAAVAMFGQHLLETREWKLERMR